MAEALIENVNNESAIAVVLSLINPGPFSNEILVGLSLPLGWHDPKQVTIGNVKAKSRYLIFINLSIMMQFQETFAVFQIY
jgi:hypothetical protein